MAKKLKSTRSKISKKALSEKSEMKTPADSSLDKNLNQKEPLTDTSRKVSEQIETRTYQEAIPGKSETLKQYLQNDGVLSDSEISQVLKEQKSESIRKVSSDASSSKQVSSHQDQPKTVLPGDSNPEISETNKNYSKKKNETQLMRPSPSLTLVDKPDILEGALVNFFTNFTRIYEARRDSNIRSPDSEKVPRASVGKQKLDSKLPDHNLSPTMNVNELPDQKTRYNWKDVAPTLEKFGLTEQKLRETGNYDKLMIGGKTDLMKAEYKDANGDNKSVSGRFYLYNTPEKGTQVFITPERQQFKAPAKFLGYELKPDDKKNLELKGEMGQKVTLIDNKTQKPFQGYIGVDPQTKSLTVLRADRVHIPLTIKGVTLTPQQQKNLEEGKAIKLAGMEGQNGQKFNAYVQVSSAKRSLSFAKIPDSAIKQTVDQNTKKDLQRPSHQLQGGGEGSSTKTITPKELATEKQAVSSGPALTKAKEQKQPGEEKAVKVNASPAKKDRGQSLT